MTWEGTTVAALERVLGPVTLPAIAGHGEDRAVLRAQRLVLEDAGRGKARCALADSLPLVCDE